MSMDASERARKVADETGTCPECGAVATLVEGSADVLLFYPHQPGCVAIAGMNVEDLLVTEVKTVADATGWELDLLGGE